MTVLFRMIKWEENSILAPKKPVRRYNKIDAWKNAVNSIQQKKKRLSLDMRLSRIFGVLPCSNDGIDSSGWSIYSTIVVLSITVVAGTLLVFVSVIQSDEVLTRRFLGAVVHSLRIIVILIHCWSTKYSSEYQEILNALKEEDSVNHRQFTIFGLLSIILYFAVSILQALAHSKEEKLYMAFEILLCCFGCVNECANFLILRQFCIIIKGLRRKLGKINTQLVFAAFSVDVYDKLCNKLDECLRLAAKTNNFYSAQILIACSYLFIKLLFLFYTTLLHTFPHCEVLLNIITKCDNILYGLALLAFLYLLVQSCEDTLKKVETFKSTLFMQLTSELAMTSHMERIQLYLEVDPSVVFTACDFFIIGYPLITSIVTAVTTYLVIIIQFN